MARPKQLALDFSSLSQEQVSYLAATNRAKRRLKKQQWNGWLAVPPGTLMEIVLKEFRDNTNIALEIPFTTLLHYISTAMITAKTVLDFRGMEIQPDFWTIVLAGSGGGKTWTEKQIRKGLGDNVQMLDSGAASAAKWLDEVSNNPRALWLRDEFFQLLKSIERDGSPLAELKDYMLRAYDNSDITRSTQKGEFIVKNPVLSILGFTALDPFVSGMSVESLTDGFAQRFAFCLARQDPARKMEDFPFWTVNTDGWAAEYDRISGQILPRYSASPEAVAAYGRIFKEHKVDGMDESFYRRVMHRAHKYALVYHVVRGAAAEPLITEEDYGWASRLIDLQLADAAEVIQLCSGNDIGKAVEAAEVIIQRLRNQGKPVTPRALVTGSRLIQSASMAKFVLEILGIPLPGK